MNKSESRPERLDPALWQQVQQHFQSLVREKKYEVIPNRTHFTATLLLNDGREVIAILDTGGEIGGVEPPSFTRGELVSLAALGVTAGDVRAVTFPSEGPNSCVFTAMKD